MKNLSLWSLVCVMSFSSILHAGTISREFRQKYDIATESLVLVENVNGNIFVESWDEDQLDLFADIEVRSGSKRAAQEHMDKVEIEVRRSGNDIKISPNYPKNSGGDGFLDWIFGGGKPNVRVNFWVKVPKNVDLELRSVNGSVEIVGIQGRCELKTTNGKISAEDIMGPVSAHTTNGSVQIEIRDSSLTDKMNFHSVNGSIKLYLPDDIQADVNISTVNGSIHTDFPMEVQGKWGPKKLTGKINGGGVFVEMETVNGSISLNEL